MPRLERNVSAIGFGCASLGSRISAADGRRAVARALDFGVTWFDVAPPYGDGQAEAILGSALKGRREKVVICTKFGIEPAVISAPARLIRPFARRAVAAFPALRRTAAAARQVIKATAIDPSAIEASVARSLRLLDTDYIDVLAIHEPTVQDAVNGEIFAVLQRLVDRGVVRAVSIAGAPQTILQAVQAARPIDFAQFSETPLTCWAPTLRNAMPAPTRFITHGVFGSGIVRVLESAEPRRRLELAALAEQYQIDVTRSYADLLLRFAFSNNPDGVVMVSMFDAGHIEHNTSEAGRQPIPGLADAVRQVLAS
jgi:aryl-alcohol dehydrogenase-like predicted oxidoreductase